MAEEPASPPLLLLDGMSLAFRAYFALPPDLATTTGVVTNAVHGFASMLVYLVREHRPIGIAVAFDLPGGTFRDEIAADYKAGRAETPDDLFPQFDMIRGLLASLAIPVVGAEGFEADDVLATLATEARDRHQSVVIVTGDRDSYQLVEDPYVRVLYNKRGVSDYAFYDEAGIQQRTGVRPDDYALLAALRGDPSDNLPGVPGVGEKTAAKLVNQYRDLETLAAHLDELTPKLRDNLRGHLDQVRRNAELIPLVRDVPLDLHIDDLTLGGWNPEDARSTFAELELKAVWGRLATLMDEGALGVPAGGVAGPVGGAGTGRTGGTGGTGRGESARSVTSGAEAVWLASTAVTVPSTAGEAVKAVKAVVAAARRTTGNVALYAGWTSDPGRSPLSSLTVVAEAVVDDRSDTDNHAPDGSGRVEGTEGAVQLRGADAATAANDATAATDAGRNAGDGPRPVDLLADRKVLAALASAFGPGGVGVVAHDAKELMRSLLPLGVDVVSLVMDTAVAAYLLDPSTERYHLADLAADHLGVQIDDGGAVGGQGAFELDVPVEAEAGGVDGDRGGVDMEAVQRAEVLARLRAPLREALEEVGESDLYDRVEQPLVRVLARMEVLGIPVDQEVLRSIAAELAEECRTLEGTLHELAEGPFNVNSVPQLRSVLYERLGLTPVRKTKTGFSTDARTLEQLRDQHPIVEVLLRYREVEKLRSTYGESLAAEVGPDGRIHATFRQTVARTGRLSSDRPNLHNIPVRTELGRQFRQAFVPSAGRRLLVADYDQVELRAIAHLSGDPGLTAAFAAGEDIHATVASQVFGVERDQVTPAMRSTAKMVSYGLAYGMEAYGLSQRLAVPVEEAQLILESYFTAFPSVREYMERAVAEARNAGYTVTAFGRRRPLPDLVASNYQVRQAAERQAMNAGIQGLAADLFKLALIRLDAGLEEAELTSGLILQVHDEVLVDVEPDEADEVAALTERALVGAADLAVPLQVDMAWGASWAEAKGT